MKVIGDIVRAGEFAVIVVEQHARLALQLTQQAIVLDRGRVVHSSTSEVVDARSCTARPAGCGRLSVGRPRTQARIAAAATAVSDRRRGRRPLDAIPAQVADARTVAADVRVRLGDLFRRVLGCMRWRRDRAELDLRNAFPDKDAAERARILRKAYRNLADTLMEAFWGFGASADALTAARVFENPELVDNALRRSSRSCC